MKNSSLYNHPRWKKLAEKVKEKANWTCEICGAIDKPLHCHHKTYVKGRQIWQYHPNLLKCLCSECHYDHHLIENEFKSPNTCQRCGNYVYEGYSENEINKEKKDYCDYCSYIGEKYGYEEAHDRGMKDLQEHGTISFEEMDKAMGITC